MFKNHNINLIIIVFYYPSGFLQTLINHLFVLNWCIWNCKESVLFLHHLLQKIWGFSNFLVTQDNCTTHIVCKNISHTDRCPNCFLEVTLLKFSINFTDRCSLFASEILCKHQQHLQGSSRAVCCAPGFTGKSKSVQLFGDFMTCLRPFQGKASTALGPQTGIQGSEHSWHESRIYGAKLLKPDQWILPAEHGGRAFFASSSYSSGFLNSIDKLSDNRRLHLSKTENV